MSRVFWLIAILSLSACQEAPAPKAERSAEMPPGFVDEPPPPPTSDTIILSGGTLLTEPPITDSVVVITDGLVMGWGQRGSQDVPNDSIGKDMRGKWLKPLGQMASGHAANFEVYSAPPEESESTGYVRGTELNLPPAD